MLSIFILELHRSNLVITAFTILKLTLLFRYKTEAPSHCYCRSILLVGNGEKICEIASQPTNVNQLQWSEALGCCVQRLRPHQSFLRKTWQLFAGLSVKFIRSIHIIIESIRSQGFRFLATKTKFYEIYAEWNRVSCSQKLIYEFEEIFYLI